VLQLLLPPLSIEQDRLKHKAIVNVMVKRQIFVPLPRNRFWLVLFQVVFMVWCLGTGMTSQNQNL